MLMPRTIDKLRSQLPAGNPGDYLINGRIKGISGYLLERIGIDEAELIKAVRIAANDDDVARWLRTHTDASQYPIVNASLRRIKPKHSENEFVFREIYAATLASRSDLEFIIDIIDADDDRIFGPG
jgi:hypothetical protein